jgi:lipopolysaccharide export system protein LptA
MKRIKLLPAGRIAALALFVSVALALAGYLFLRQRRVDREQPRPKLQGQVVAVFSNTRYAHEVQGQVRFILTSAIDRSYSDGSHELEGVKLESFGRNNDRHDVVTANQARVSNPSDLEKLDAEFISNVVVQTKDGLTVKSEYLRYRRENNTIETDKLVEFEGRNFSGRSIGLYLEADNERAELLGEVDVTVQENPKSGDGSAAGANSGSNERTPEEKAARKAEKRRRKLARKQARAARVAARGRKEKRKSGGGIADFTASKEPTRIRAQSALIEKKDHRITLTRDVIITQEEKEARADKMIAWVDASNHLDRIESRGNSYLKEVDRAELRSPDIDLFFGPSHQLVRGVATGGARSRSLGEGPLRESHADRIEATFAETDQGSVAETLTATGNAMVKFYPATDDSAKNPTERELRSDSITLHFQPDGHFLKSADAVGRSVITVLPVRAEPKADKKTIQADGMNAVFFDEGNKIKTFTGTDNVRIEIAALLAGQHEPRITTSARVTADLLPDSQDIDRAVQEGDFKYREGDRNATADRAVYDGQKEFLQLRGRRPMAWDSKGRTQADEIDYDRQNDETHARGDVRTTYYSRESAGETTPFNNTKSPVFLTAERADARNKDGIAVYTINARGWQDDNFIRADRIELYQKDKRMVATGNVESSLYRVKKGTPGSEEALKQPDPKADAGEEDEQSRKSKRRGKKGAAQNNEEAPAFAWADRMTYSDAERLVHYDGSVRARHGADYIEGDSVDVFLEQETNEVNRIKAVGNVLLVQPGRRGTGDNFHYTADDGRAVLTGRNARVEDKEKGSTMGTQLTFYSRDDKIIVENQQGIGRVRTTHRMAKNR